MKNIMGSDEVCSEERTTPEAVECDGGEGDGDGDEGEGELTDDEKALLAAWDKRNAPSRTADPQFEARVLAALDERMAAAPGEHETQRAQAAALKDDVTLTEMAAEANAAGAESRAPILVDVSGPDSGGNPREDAGGRDWSGWAAAARSRREGERDELSFMVRPGGDSRAARDPAASWEAFMHHHPDDPSKLRQKVARRMEDDRWKVAREVAQDLQPPPARTASVLFIAASPRKTTWNSLALSCAAIEQRLKRARLRDRFHFESRWATTLPEVTGHLAELDPMILHFVGHGGPGAERASDGLVFQDAQGNARPVPSHALARMIDAAGRSLRMVVLDGCFWRKQAEALRRRVDCVIGTHGAVDDEVARQFSEQLYAALGKRRSIGTAFECGVAALATAGRAKDIQTSCLARKGIDVHQLQLWAAPQTPPP